MAGLSAPILIQQVPLDIRAALQPTTANDDKRTVEVIFSTGAPVDRFDWMSGKRYVERLSLEPAHVRLARLNAGGPVLDTHDSYSVRDMLGSVVPGSAVVKNGAARAVLQFSMRKEVDGVWQDIRDGRIRNTSVGYRTYAFQEVTPKDGGTPTRTAIDWEPFEISMVPMPADPGAQTRADDRQRAANPCEIIFRVDDSADADRLRLVRLARARASHKEHVR